MKVRAKEMENTNYGETVVLDENIQHTEQQYTSQQYANSQYTNQQYANPQYINPQFANQQFVNPQNSALRSNVPMYQHPTNRGLGKFILLTLITFGIYGMVTWCKMITELNVAASRYDGKRTCPYFAAMMLTTITYGVFAFVWQHNMANRIGAEVRRRGYDYKISASDFWLWGILGSFIFVGPFVYCHKLLKGMNLINSSYNVYG